MKCYYVVMNDRGMIYKRLDQVETPHYCIFLVKSIADAMVDKFREAALPAKVIFMDEFQLANDYGIVLQ